MAASKTNIAGRQGDNSIHSVLVTGATSQLGRQVTRQLYYDKKVSTIIGVGLEERPYYFDDYDPGRFIYKKVNILKSRQLHNLFLADYFREAEVDTVIHLAFANRLSGYGKDSHSLNIEGTKGLLDMCEDEGTIRKFIFKSSHIVYAVKPENPVLLDESAELNFSPKADPWIRDRVDADMLCRAKMDSPHLQVIVLRPSNIIERDAGGGLNAYFDSRVCMTVMGYDPMLNLVHVKDVVRAIQLGVHKNVKGVFNIIGRETAPLSKFIELAGKQKLALPENLLPRVNRIGRRFGFTQYYVSVDRELLKNSLLLDDTRARKILGYVPANHVQFS